MVICDETKSMNVWSVGKRNIVCPTENYATRKPVGNSVTRHMCFGIFFSAVMCLKMIHEYPEAKLNAELQGKKGLLYQRKRSQTARQEV